MSGPMIVAGIGCRKGVPVETVLTALTDAMAKTGLGDRRPVALATGAIKAGEPALAQAAQQLGIPLIVVDQAAIDMAAPHTMTRSAASLHYANTPSLCEAAALAAAGDLGRREAGPTSAKADGQYATLAGPRLVREGVTCALALVMPNDLITPCPTVSDSGFPLQEDQPPAIDTKPAFAPTTTIADETTPGKTS